LTADDGFFAYLSTDNSTLGIPLTSGTYWPTPQSFSINLTSNVTYYLQIEAVNQWIFGGILGEFKLSDGNYRFSNGTQNLLTDTSHWFGTYNSHQAGETGYDPSLIKPQSWIQPSGAVVFSQKDDGSPSAINSGAQWIWSTDAMNGARGACEFCTVDFSTTILPTPLPSTGSMMLIGLAGLVLLLGVRGTGKMLASA
jgi:hypothetical protein